MKKVLLLLILLLGINTALAQKHYVTVYCPMATGYAIRLSGDIPSSMKDTYYGNDFHKDAYAPSNYWMGNVLNLLSDEGYEVEQMTSTHVDDTPITIYLLSRLGKTLPNDAPQITETDTAVTPVARYNLQGQLISPDTKGIQIIVYSDYSTQTIINE